MSNGVEEAINNAIRVDPGAEKDEPEKKRKPRSRGGGGDGSPPSGSDGERRLIQYRASKPDVAADDAEDALIASGLPVFHRGGELVEPCVERTLGYGGEEMRTVMLRKISEPRLIDLLAQSSRWERFDQREQKYVPVAPPRIAAQILLERCGKWRFPPVAGVIEHFAMRRDGSLIVTPGYDERTQLYLAVDPRIIPPGIAAYPSWAEAEQAAKVLDELLDEFPFADPDVDRAVALSVLMTPILRTAMDIAPLHCVSAPTYGSGKSFLVTLASTISTSRPPAMITASGDPEETEKRIDSALLGGKNLIVLDNANGELGGDKLAIAIDQRCVSVRVLGASRTVEIQNQACLFATGVNLAVRGDIVRRALMVTLNPKEERPEGRVFSRNPLEEILADRGKYITAVLTIARAYIAAGEPEVEYARVASFAAWSRFVQRPLVWLGYTDPAKSMLTGEEQDSERMAIAEVIGAWPTDSDRSRATVNALVGHANADSALKQALLAIAGNRDQTINPLRLSKWLRRHAGRVVDGAKIVRDGEDSKRKSPRWRVVSVC